MDVSESDKSKSHHYMFFLIDPQIDYLFVEGSNFIQLTTNQFISCHDYESTFIKNNKKTCTVALFGDFDATTIKILCKLRYYCIIALPTRILNASYHILLANLETRLTSNCEGHSVPTRHLGFP